MSLGEGKAQCWDIVLRVVTDFRENPKWYMANGGAQWMLASFPRPKLPKSPELQTM
jgi:hypothetical protein